MKTVELSTGVTAVIRTKDELTEGQSRRIEIARSRGLAITQRLQKPVYIDEDGAETFTVTSIRAKIDDAPKIATPTAILNELSDDDWKLINGYGDALVVELTDSISGGEYGDKVSVSDPTILRKPDFDKLSASVLEEYDGSVTGDEGPDEKINPLVEAAGSTDSSSLAADQT